MYTLTQSQIENIKAFIAEKELRLAEDITDTDVFEYIEDMESAEELKQISTNGSNNVDDWTVNKIRTRNRIVMDIVDCVTELRSATL